MEATTKLGTDNTRRRNTFTTEQDVLHRHKEQGMGLTLTFARDLAKHAPLSLYYPCVSLLLEVGRAGSSPPFGRDESEAVHEDVPDY